MADTSAAACIWGGLWRRTAIESVPSHSQTAATGCRVRANPSADRAPIRSHRGQPPLSAAGIAKAMMNPPANAKARTFVRASLVNECPQSDLFVLFGLFF